MGLRKAQFTLADVISGRYRHPTEGWIDEQLYLSPKQKEAFLALFDGRVSPLIRSSLSDFIERGNYAKVANLRIYRQVVFYFEDNTCRYVPGQDESAELQSIVQSLVW